jgi:hypothetical protein
LRRLADSATTGPFQTFNPPVVGRAIATPAARTLTYTSFVQNFGKACEVSQKTCLNCLSKQYSWYKKLEKTSCLKHFKRFGKPSRDFSLASVCQMLLWCGLNPFGAFLSYQGHKTLSSMLESKENCNLNTEFLPYLDSGGLSSRADASSPSLPKQSGLTGTEST